MTTGLASTGEYQPICVMIENMPEARPQAGLSEADIVYEIYMEGCSITRFEAVFNDNKPTNVGPVRSCRLPFVRIAEEYHSALAHYGGPDGTDANIYPMLSNLLKNKKLLWDFDGWRDYGENSKYGIYWRAKGKAAPHNVYSNLTKVSALMTNPVTPVPHFLFDANASLDGDSATNLEIKYTTSSVDTVYKYDEATAKYNRFITGKPMIDENNKQQVAVTNVIIQYAKLTFLNTAKDHIDMEQIGSGKADIMFGGKHIQGSWKKASENDITKYYDASGAEIKLLPGNTWVELVPSNRNVPVKFS